MRNGYSEPLKRRGTPVKEMFGGLLPELKVIPLSESNLLGAPLFEEGVSAVISERREALE